jgi:hypothetical protein
MSSQGSARATPVRTRQRVSVSGAGGWPVRRDGRSDETPRHRPLSSCACFRAAGRAGPPAPASRLRLVRARACSCPCVRVCVMCVCEAAGSGTRVCVCVCVCVRVRGCRVRDTSARAGPRALVRRSRRAMGVRGVRARAARALSPCVRARVRACASSKRLREATCEARESSMCACPRVACGYSVALGGEARRTVLLARLLGLSLVPRARVRGGAPHGRLLASALRGAPFLRADGGVRGEGRCLCVCVSAPAAVTWRCAVRRLGTICRRVPS